MAPIFGAGPSEILALADRILVMYEGRVVAALPRSEADEAILGFYMAGGRAEATQAVDAAAKDFDYVVVNDDLERAVAQISCILTAETLRTSRLDPSHLVPALA